MARSFRHDRSKATQAKPDLPCLFRPAPPHPPSVLQVKSDFMTHSMQQQLALRNLQKEAMLMSKLRHPNGERRCSRQHVLRPLCLQWPCSQPAAAPGCCTTVHGSTAAAGVHAGVACAVPLPRRCCGPHHSASASPSASACSLLVPRRREQPPLPGHGGVRRSLSPCMRGVFGAVCRGLFTSACPTHRGCWRFDAVRRWRTRASTSAALQNLS